jgi:hypothetical protein
MIISFAKAHFFELSWGMNVDQVSLGTGGKAETSF